MNFEEMSKEELIEYIKNINETNNGKYVSSQKVRNVQNME